MSKIAVPIRVDNSLPEPHIPEPFTDPIEIQGQFFSGSNWVWGGDRVELIRMNEGLTIDNHIDQLWECHAHKVMRPLQACELKQFERHMDLWPELWIEKSGNGRVFFAGTIYKIRYANRETHDLIWYAAYNNESMQWQFGCLPTYLTLRKSDTFACIPGDGKKEIPDIPEWPALPPERPAYHSIRGRDSFKGR